MPDGAPTVATWLNIIETGSVVVAAIVAVCGISAWRKELRGRREYELAEEVLALFYEARDLIQFIRSPFGYSGEGATRKAEVVESPQQKQLRDRAYVVYERYNKKPEIFDRLHALRYRVMALLGSDAAAPFDELRKIRSEIFVNADMLSEWLWAEDDRETRKANRQRKLDAEAVIWATGGETDKIAQRVDVAVEQMESICAPIIREIVFRRKVGRSIKRWIEKKIFNQEQLRKT